MEIRYEDSAKQDCPEKLPYLFQKMEANALDGFDTHKERPTPVHNPALESVRSQGVSISMPSSPTLLHLGKTKRALCNDDIGEAVHLSRITDHPVSSSFDFIQMPKQSKFYSQPMPSVAPSFVKADAVGPCEERKKDTVNTIKDTRFDSFKTWSGRLERQFSHLVGSTQEQKPEPTVVEALQNESLPVDRFFDALKGPELDTLRDSEELVLPGDKTWPFLLRFPISSFGICLGISSQAILWKTLATSPSTEFLHISPAINLALWYIAIAAMAMVSFIYILKVIFYFEAVRREYYHPIRVNFFFAPWVACLFLVLGQPLHITKPPPLFLWYVLMAPILCLEIKIYGQWMSGGQRRLSKVANPSNHLSVVGNFVLALLGATMGLREGPLFFFAVGISHYTVLFVTLYQRLPTNETLPKELHPVFFLFVAAPSVASMAWAKLQGEFDYGARIAYFIALFLYASLAIRINFFRGFRFSLAWWAYTFPMTGASVATIKYANQVQHPITQAMSVTLSAIASVTVTALLISTIIHAFVLRDLFPNDISIAISHRKLKGSSVGIKLQGFAE